MARVTSKLQVTVPKVIAEQYRIRPGDDIEWIPAGDAVRVRKAPPRRQKEAASTGTRRLELFDLATQRQQRRQRRVKTKQATTDRGWRREDLYDRGGAG